RARRHGPLSTLGCADDGDTMIGHGLLLWMIGRPRVSRRCCVDRIERAEGASRQFQAGTSDWSDRTISVDISILGRLALGGWQSPTRTEESS
ncbi:MAG: hypothetical protein ACRDO2_06275, partial [Nocardioidaceae bacterium]